MTQFGQSEMVIARNQLSLFAPKSDRDIPGQIGTNRDNLTGGEGHIPGHSGTPPLKGGVHCPGVTGRDMSRSRPVPAKGITNRNESAEGNFDPASAYPTKASIAVADKAWDQEYLDWQAAGCPGGPDAWPRPPAGLTSAIADHLIPRPGCHRRTPQHGKRWR
jgi:hypothetical protein